MITFMHDCEEFIHSLTLWASLKTTQRYETNKGTTDN